MKKIDTKLLVKYGMLMALTTIMTMFVSIPTFATKGYLNLGDMVVFIGALYLGRKGGFIIGGVGSGLADLLLGYTHYVPITFVVKGLEGYIAGHLLETKLGKRYPIIPTAIGGLWMSLGYYIFQIPMYGKEAALLSVPGNIGQGLFGALAAVGLYTALNKVGNLNKIN